MNVKDTAAYRKVKMNCSDCGKEYDKETGDHNENMCYKCIDNSNYVHEMIATLFPPNP